MHLGVAAITEYEEVVINEAQADQLAKASAAVMAHYTDTQVPAKVLDWGNLFSALASVYIPMGMAISAKRRREAAQAPPRPVSQTPRPSQAQGPDGVGAANVVEIPGVGKVERFDQ